MIFLDVDAAVTVPVNLLPLIDDTDFKSREVSIAYNAAGMDLVWNFVTSAGVITQTAVTPTTSGDYDWTHVGDGIYKIEMPASGGASINNDAEGYGWFSGVCTGVLPWRGPVIGFRAAAINDALVDGGDTLKVDVETIKTNPVVNAGTITFPTGATLASTTNIAAGTITTATNLTNLPAIPTDWLTADGLAADAVNEIQSGLSTLTQTQVTGGAYALNSSSFAFNAALDFTTTQKAATLANVSTLAGAATVVLTDASLTTAKLGTFALAKTTNITGFNDVTAAEVNTAVEGGQVGTDVTTIVSRITSTLFSGITSLAEWLGALAGKQAADATALTEIKATGAGSGTFSETTDSLEGIRDNTAWNTAVGFSTHSAAEVYTAFGDGVNLTEVGGDGDHLTAIPKTGYKLASDGMDSVTLPANLITNTSIANDAITAAKVAADVHQELIELAFTYDATANYAGATSGSLVLEIADNAVNATALAAIQSEVDTALATYDGPTNAEMEARTPTAAQLAYIVANAATGVPVTFTTSGGSVTAAVLNQVDGAGASATDDQYNGRLLVFTDGTLKDVVTDITDYDGGTTTATITAIPFAPTSSHNARLI